MSTITENIGQLLKSVRKEKGLTQKEVGKLLGIAEATYNRYETGQNLTIETLDKVAEALGVKLNITLDK